MTLSWPKCEALAVGFGNHLAKSSKFAPSVREDDHHHRGSQLQGCMFSSVFSYLFVVTVLLSMN